MAQDIPKPEFNTFTEQDALHLLQLRTSQHVSNTERADATDSDEVASSSRTTDPTEFTTNLGRVSYVWQIEAIQEWKKAGHRGVVKVVTGAGKTVMALQAIEEAFHLNPRLKVSIVVPTIVLLEQWHQDLTDYSNISLALIGRHGGGYTDSFCNGKQLMIWVINSAARLLPSDLSKSRSEGGHFLVVDECHRSGSQEFRRIYQAPRSLSLGLSATPERAEDTSVEEPEAWDSGPHSGSPVENEITDPVQAELGPVIYELTFARAVEEGIIPRFDIINYAVDFVPHERARYDRISREMQDLDREIRHSQEFLNMRRRRQSFSDFRVIRSLAERGKNAAIRSKAARYDRLVSDRRRLLYSAQNREICLLSVLEKELAGGSQVIVFHESIAQINALFHGLRDRFPVVLYHSQISNSIRDEALRLYWKGTARIILSAKALIEGYNVPSTDVGVIVASSSSPRQRIQTIGRVLRKAPGKESSMVYNIYVHSSSDEAIFSRYSWESIAGSEAISYYRWHTPEHLDPMPGPPATPLVAEREIDADSLRAGDVYPGAFEGDEVSVDTQARVFRYTEAGGREYASLSDVGLAVIKVKGSAGSFKVTRFRHLVLVRKTDGDGNWATYYVATLAEPLQFADDAGRYTEYLFRQRGGGTITKREGRTQYMDDSSQHALRIMNALKAVPGKFGWPLPSRFYLADDGKTVHVRGPDGKLTPVLTLDTPYAMKALA